MGGTGDQAGEVIGKDVGRRRLGCLALVAALFAILLGILCFLANAMEAQDRGTYCESLDHPGKCSSPLEFIIPGSVLIALGCIGIWWGIRLRRADRWVGHGR